MRDDDDVLADYDLSAWDVPPPSPGLADAVVARAKRAPAVGAAEEDPTGKPARRWWIGGVVAAGVAATLAVGVWGLQRAPKDGGGDVVATRAQLVELGPSSVQLDPGAEMHWRRDKHRVTVTQPRGAASWTIHGDDTFVIDAGAMVAAVEASGASLRVEVTMNVSDARVIGASAVTAAVVAMVTVVVYEGRVRVAHGGQTVTVEAGATLELHNPALESSPVAVGASVDQLAALQREIEELRLQVAKAQLERRTLAPAPTPCDEVSCVLNNYEGDCCLKFKKTPKPQPAAVAACDAAALAKKGDASLGAGMFAAALLSYEQALDCKPDTATLKKAAMAACRSKNAAKASVLIAKIPSGQQAPLVQICVREGLDPTCDANALREKGQDALQTGADARALEQFEASLACKSDPSTVRLAFLAACRSKNADSARRHYAELPPTTTTGLIQICVRNGITEEQMQGNVPTTGTLRIQSAPSAKIFVDGREVGTTPALVKVAPGKHKITFQLDDNKYTFSSTVEAGKTVTITKDLR